MQNARNNSNPGKRILGILLEMIGLIVVASGFLRLNNFLLEYGLIIVGFLIFVLGAKCRFK